MALTSKDIVTDTEYPKYTISIDSTVTAGGVM